MTGLDDQRSTLVGPPEGLRAVIVILNEGQDPLTQRLQRCEAPTLERPPRQETEPHLDLVQPGCMRRCVHKLDAVACIAQPRRSARHRLQSATTTQLCYLLLQPTLLRYQVYQAYRLMDIQPIHHEDPYSLRIARQCARNVGRKVLLSSSRTQRRLGDLARA